ncbi:MAG: Sapep family Mn(2+)-dependent dipeptidase [Erysipelotrichaceae bacterium]
MNINEKIKNYEPKLLEIIKNLVSFNSVYDDSNPEYVFGKENKECLEYMLSVCEKDGFFTKNLDNYCGYAQFGDSGELIGIIGHLDIVPAGEGWDTNPFELTVKEGTLYGRGVCDDKGSMAAAYIALKIVADIKKDINKRIRIVFGCNEETEFRCIDHYVKKEGHFDIGFTPDGPFPLCHGEKGIVHYSFKVKSEIFKSLSAGVAVNSVPSIARFELNSNFDEIAFESYLIENGLSLTKKDSQFTVYGKAAHGSTPENGINALTYTLLGLYNQFNNDEALSLFNKYFNNSFNGDNLDVHYHDLSGLLTMNVGRANLVEGKIHFEIDVRVPITVSNQEVLDKIEKYLGNYEFKIEGNKKSLYYPLDKPIVTKLMKAYTDVMGEAKPVTMGGGTYARGINNCVAFGPEFEGYDSHMHDVNECTTLENLNKSIEIYVNALLNLLED